MIIRSISLLVFMFSGFFLTAQTFITSNTNGQVTFQVSISVDQDQKAEVERHILEHSNRSEVLKNPLINLSALEASSNNTFTIPQGSDSYHLVPINHRESMIKLQGGDVVKYYCSCGESITEGDTDCNILTNKSAYSAPALHCNITDGCYGVCQGHIHVYRGDDVLMHRTISGAVLIQAASAKVGKRR